MGWSGWLLSIRLPDLSDYPCRYVRLILTERTEISLMPQESLGAFDFSETTKGIGVPVRLEHLYL